MPGNGTGASLPTTDTITSTTSANSNITPATNTVNSGSTETSMVTSGSTDTSTVTPNSSSDIGSGSGSGDSSSHEDDDDDTNTTTSNSTNCTVSTSSSTREFTWMSGSNTGGASGVYGMKGTAAVGNVPGAREGAASWTGIGGKLWLFGGAGYDSGGSRNDLNDLWMYDPSSGQWTWESGSNTVLASGSYGTQGTAAASNVPGARYSAASWTDASGDLWLFGGNAYDPNSSSGDFLNDLWKYDPSSGQWTWEGGSSTAGASGSYGTKGTAAASNVPGARYSTITWTDASGNLWLFGGVGYGNTNSVMGYLNDLWKYDPSSGQWTWESGSNTVTAIGSYGTQGTAAASNVPGGRFGAVSWTDASGNFWLFGGTGYNATSNWGSLNDLWKYDPSSGQWTWESGSNTFNAIGSYGTQGTAAASNVPGARDSAISWTDTSGKLWLFGGFGYGTTASSLGYLNDLWKYDPSSGQWSWEAGSSTTSTTGATGVYGTQGTAAANNIPGVRIHSVSWIDANGNPWLFGGWGVDSTAVHYDDLNDLWLYQ